MTDVILPIPDGCSSLWRADATNVDPAQVYQQAALAARRTHTAQAVHYADGSTVVIPAGVVGVIAHAPGD